MPRGGKREGAGRKKVDRSTTPSVAANVLKKQKSEALWNEMVETSLQVMRTSGKTGPLRDTLRYLEDRAYGRPMDTVNHLHDKPLEVNMNVRMADILREVRQRKQDYERNRS